MEINADRLTPAERNEVQLHYLRAWLGRKRRNHKVAHTMRRSSNEKRKAWALAHVAVTTGHNHRLPILVSTATRSSSNASGNMPVGTTEQS